MRETPQGQMVSSSSEITTSHLMYCFKVNLLCFIGWTKYLRQYKKLVWPLVTVTFFTVNISIWNLYQICILNYILKLHFIWPHTHQTYLIWLCHKIIVLCCLMIIAVLIHVIALLIRNRETLQYVKKFFYIWCYWNSSAFLLAKTMLVYNAWQSYLLVSQFPTQEKIV